MAIFLGGVELSEHMVWSDRDRYSPVSQTLTRTLGGEAIIYTQALYKGVPITLEAQQDTGWLTYAQVKDVRALAEVPGAEYQLSFYGGLYNVIFAHHDGDACSFTPLSYRVVHDDTDYFTGVIKLITV